MKPYTAAQAAERLGLSLGTFHRNFARLIVAGMPAPLLPFGRKRFDRARFEAWIAHRSIPSPANDAAALTLDEQRAALAREYATG